MFQFLHNLCPVPMKNIFSRVVGKCFFGSCKQYEILIFIIHVKVLGADHNSPSKVKVTVNN